MPELELSPLFIKQQQHICFQTEQVQDLSQGHMGLPLLLEGTPVGFMRC